MTSRWSIAIFTSREDAATLQRTLRAVIAASASAPCTIDVLVDGNRDTATRIADWSVEPTLPADSTMRLWLVPWGDKACAWNRYVHEIAPPSGVAFFVDGYVRPRPGSLAALAHALDADPHAWAASGVPTVGPSAASQRRRLLAEGGLHGNLYALRGTVIDRLKQRGFMLPLGLYRNDSLIGAVMCFGADPATHAWDTTRIAVVSDASWDNDLPTALSMNRARAYLKRRMRQAQGELENAAVRQHLAIRKLAPERLPRTARELVEGGPREAITKRGVIDRYLMRRALERLAFDRDWSTCRQSAQLLRTWERT